MIKKRIIRNIKNKIKIFKKNDKLLKSREELHSTIVQAKLTWHRYNVQRNDQLRTSIELPPEIIFLLFITIYLIILLLNIK